MNQFIAGFVVLVLVLVLAHGGHLGGAAKSAANKLIGQKDETMVEGAARVVGAASGVPAPIGALDLLRLKAMASPMAARGPSLSVGYGEKMGFAPEALHAAEQEAWGRSGAGDALEGGAPCVSAATAPYSEYLAGAVADPKMRANHARWAKETRPYSGVAMAVDSLEPGNYLPWQGLRMPQGVKQSNPLFVTEVDEADLAGNKKFLFNQ